MKTKTSNTLLFAAGGGLLFWGGVKTLVQPAASTAKSAASLGGLGMLVYAAYRMNPKAGIVIGSVAAATIAAGRLRGRGTAVGAAEHPGLGPSLAIQEAAWRGQPNAQKMYPWEQIFSQPTVASGGYSVGADGELYAQEPYADPYAQPYAQPYAAPGASSGDSGGNSSGGNPTRTSTEVRSPTSTSTEVRSPTSTSTEVRSPTSTSTEAFTADNFTATVTGGAGAGATTSVNIYFTPPDHMADGKGHTSHVGVTQMPGEESEEGYSGMNGYYPPYLPR
jgi:hypothetical protein